jgi:hypothetical protein
VPIPKHQVTSTGDAIQRYSDDVPQGPIAPAAISGTRKIFGFLIRAIGAVLGAAAGSLYVFLMWSSPPDLSNVHRLGTVIGLFLVIPLLLFFGPFWLADWLAAFIDRRRLT